MKPSSRAALLKAQQGLDDALVECLSEAVDASAETRGKILANIQPLQHFIEVIKNLVDPPRHGQYGNLVNAAQQFQGLGMDKSLAETTKEAW